MCIRLADEESLVVSRHLEAVRQYEEAATLAAEVAERDAHLGARCHAAALMGAGMAFVLVEDYASGVERLEEALSVLSPSASDESRVTDELRAGILNGLADALAGMGRHDAAVGRRNDALGLLEALPRRSPRMEEALMETLICLGRDLATNGKHRECQPYLARAIEMLRALDSVESLDRLMWESSAYTQLGTAYRATSSWSRLKELQRRALAEGQTLAASFTAHEGAEAYYHLEGAYGRVDSFESLYEDTREEETDPAEARLLAICRADPDSVGREIEMIDQHLARGDEEGLSAEWWTELVRSSYYWRRVLVLQRMAAILCSYRQSGEGDGAVLVEWAERDDSLYKYPEGEVRLPGFPLEDVDILRQVVVGGEVLLRTRVEAGPLGDASRHYHRDSNGGYWDTDRSLDEDVELPPDEEVALCLVPYRELPPDVPQGWCLIWDVLTQLQHFAYWDEPRLRRCMMLDGFEAYLDCCLEGREEEAEICARYYIAQKDTATCGRAVCVQNYTRLDNLQAELEERARKRARRLWRQAGRPGVFETLWEKAGKNQLQFEELLGSSRS